MLQHPSLRLIFQAEHGVYLKLNKVLRSSEWVSLLWKTIEFRTIKQGVATSIYVRIDKCKHPCWPAQKFWKGFYYHQSSTLWPTSVQNILKIQFKVGQMVFSMSNRLCSNCKHCGTDNPPEPSPTCKNSTIRYLLKDQYFQRNLCLNAKSITLSCSPLSLLYQFCQLCTSRVCSEPQRFSILSHS